MTRDRNPLGKTFFFVVVQFLHACMTSAYIRYTSPYTHTHTRFILFLLILMLNTYPIHVLVLLWLRRKKREENGIRAKHPEDKSSNFGTQKEKKKTLQGPTIEIFFADWFDFCLHKKILTMQLRKNKRRECAGSNIRFEDWSSALPGSSQLGNTSDSLSHMRWLVSGKKAYFSVHHR